LGDIKHILGREGIALNAIASFRLSPVRLASLVAMSAGGKISGKNAKQTVEEVIKEDKDPERIVREKGWEQLCDPALIAGAVEAAFAAEADPVQTLRSLIAGADSAKEKRRRALTAYLVGKVLAATGGRADPNIAGAQVEALLRR
jgi:aspartyl-tRNA(Asn)/glutamyl-tRNA(Gln) amidotransferase subunit B